MVIPPRWLTEQPNILSDDKKSSRKKFEGLAFRTDFRGEKTDRIGHGQGLKIPG
jgi:hypothetical protein